jgi:hypothetical protein
VSPFVTGFIDWWQRQRLQWTRRRSGWCRPIDTACAPEAAPAEASRLLP